MTNSMILLNLFDDLNPHKVTSQKYYIGLIYFQITQHEMSILNSEADPSILRHFSASSLSLNYSEDFILMDILWGKAAASI